MLFIPSSAFHYFFYNFKVTVSNTEIPDTSFIIKKGLSTLISKLHMKYKKAWQLYNIITIITIISFH